MEHVGAVFAQLVADATVTYFLETDRTTHQAAQPTTQSCTRSGHVGWYRTGKSTLINAIIGKRLCQAGDVQRPTTTSPTVLHHPTIETDFLPTREWGAKPIAADLPLLEQVIVIDCPDPDTQGNDTIQNIAIVSYYKKIITALRCFDLHRHSTEV